MKSKPYLNTDSIGLEEFKRIKGFKILSVNVRSLLPKWDIFQYSYLDGDINVVCCNETWLVKEVPDSLMANDNYSVYRMDRRCLNQNGTVKSGGGVCTFVNNRCITDNVVFEKFDVSNSNLEVLCLKVTCGGNRSLAVVNIYVI